MQVAHFSSLFIVATFALPACGPAPTAAGILISGVPVDDAAVQAFVAAYVTYAGEPGRQLTGDIDFRPFSDFAECGRGTLQGCPHTLLGPSFAMTVDAPRPGWTLRETSLAHELTHVLYQDPGHTRADLWGVAGILARWTGYVEGQNPANREWNAAHQR